MDWGHWILPEFLPTIGFQSPATGIIAHGQIDGCIARKFDLSASQWLNSQKYNYLNWH
jgi:hypothetical protein